MSAGLALELAKIKYYQNLYKDEFLGNEDQNIEGLINIRRRLLDEIALKQVEIAENKPMIDHYQKLIDLYDSESQAQRDLLDEGAQSTVSYSVGGLVPGSTYDVAVNVTVDNDPATATDSETGVAINSGNEVLFRSFYIEGSAITELLSVEFDITKQLFDFQTKIKITFKNDGDLVLEKNITFLDVNKEIPLTTPITATHFDIEIKNLASVKYASSDTGASFQVSKISIFEEDTETPVFYYYWDNFRSQQLALKQDTEAKITQLELDINRIRFGTEDSFDATSATALDEDYVFGATEDEDAILGLAQIDERLEYIRTKTAINHESLEASAPAVLTELKTIRRGAVYQNNDIRNSRTLFIAAKDYLEEHIYPRINVNISSVSILQTYEGYEDWDKVRIGEIVTIFVPQLGINVEAEIQELNINFQSYSTSIGISTIDKYDKSFGRMFANTMLQAEEIKTNDLDPVEKQNNNAGKVIGGTGGTILELLGNQGNIHNEFEDNRGIFLSERFPTANTFFDQFEEERIVTGGQDLTAQYVDLGSNTFTNVKPVYYLVDKGSAEIKNGGLVIKNEAGEVKIKLNASEGFVAYNNENVETVKIDLDGNAKFAGELVAASGTFGEVEIAENGSLQVGNITINQAGITAVSDLENPATTQTLFIDSTNGDVFIKGTIQEGTVFEDALTREINVSGGTRIINYDADDTLPDGQEPDEIMGTFTANVFRNGQNISDPNVYNVQYSWAVEGLLTLDSNGDTVDDIATTNRTFAPAIKTTYTNDPTQIILTVTYPDNQQIVEIIPINITKDGIAGVNGYNQAQIYIYKRVSGTAPTNVGTITGLYNFEDAAFSSQTPFSSNSG